MSIPTATTRSTRPTATSPTATLPTCSASPATTCSPATSWPAANGMADGFDKLAAYGKVGTPFRWLIDVNNDGVPDLNAIQQPLFAGVTSVNGMPAAGNFDGNRDKRTPTRTPSTATRSCSRSATSGCSTPTTISSVDAKLAGHEHGRRADRRRLRQRRLRRPGRLGRRQVRARPDHGRRRHAGRGRWHVRRQLHLRVPQHAGAAGRRRFRRRRHRRPGPVGSRPRRRAPSESAEWYLLLSTPQQTVPAADCEPTSAS